MDQGSSLRRRNRRNTMMHVQDVAYELFAERDPDDVTVEEIAKAAGVGPATVYRQFGSKDRIVSWNENDEQIAAAVVRRVGELPAFDALRTAFAVDIAPLIDNERQRKQFRLIFGKPGLAGSIAAFDEAAVSTVSKTLLEAGGAASPLIAEVQARSALGALDAAFDAWQQATDATPLSAFIDRAFDALAGFGATEAAP